MGFEEIWTYEKVAFYALQVVFKTMQTRLFHYNYSIIILPWPWVGQVLHFMSFNLRPPPTTVFFIFRVERRELIAVHLLCYSDMYDISNQISHCMNYIQIVCLGFQNLYSSVLHNIWMAKGLIGINRFISGSLKWSGSFFKP